MDLYLTIKPLHIQYIGCPRKIKSQIGLESFSGHQYFEKKNVNIIVIPQIFTNFALGLWKRPGDMHVPGPPKGEG